MKKIDYNQNNLSHVPKSIIYWVSQGVVIDGVRYAVKEFRVEEDKFKLVVEKNGEFFEVDASTNSGGSATVDPSTLEKYLTPEKIIAGEGMNIQKSSKEVSIGITGQNIKRLESVDKLIDIRNRECVRDFNSIESHYIVYGTPNTDTMYHTPISIEALVTNDSVVYIDYMARNIDGMSLWDYITKNNELGVPLNKVRVSDVEQPHDLPSNVDEANNMMMYAINKKPGETVTVRFDKE